MKAGSAAHARGAVALMPLPIGVLALTIVFPEIILVLPRLVSPEFLK